MSEDLKPCPFCGGPAVYFDGIDPDPDTGGADLVQCDPDSDCRMATVIFEVGDWNAERPTDCLRAALANIRGGVTPPISAWIDKLIRMAGLDPDEIGATDPVATLAKEEE